MQAADGAEALEVIEKVRPSLILLNLTLPIVDSLSVLTDIQYFMGRQARVVLTGAHQVLLRAVQSAKLNIDGFLETPIAPEDLLLYVATALNHRGETA
jgi:DNA-binding NtrC family response regulator